LSRVIRSTSPHIADSLRKSYVYKFIDSILVVRPSSLVIPHLIRFYSKRLGDDLARSLFTRLSIEQQNSIDGIRIKNFLNQRSLLKKEMVFEDFSLRDVKGDVFTLYSDSSNYILLDFWSSYCGPCRLNHRTLREVYAKLKQKGLQIISVSLDTDKEQWIKAIKDDKLEWKNFSDLQGLAGFFPKKYNIKAIPFSILLDKNKNVIAIDLHAQELLFYLQNEFTH
jgi:peroxiredoxin